MLLMLGLTVLPCPVGETKLSEYPEKLCLPEERQYPEPPSWEAADELSALWCTEVGGKGCGRWTVLGCSEAGESKKKELMILPTLYICMRFIISANSLNIKTNV